MATGGSSFDVARHFWRLPEFRHCPPYRNDAGKEPKTAAGKAPMVRTKQCIVAAAEPGMERLRRTWNASLNSSALVATRLAAASARAAPLKRSRYTMIPAAASSAAGWLTLHLGNKYSGSLTTRPRGNK